ncbi:hypothetical protein NQ317_018646 [Molorchus minor]|uniref:Uncharacterized protein n=1 Tax=Molorchus minor TaxID=1323400 RepID=A0ABQ9JWJ8_9CUCU|nr:hypothetical protein NQ317_018646 [Molorchus minor]
MGVWAIITLPMSLLDLIFTILLATDYVSCGRLLDDLTQDEYFCYLDVGIVMTISARGFTLWVVNIILALVMLKDITTFNDSQGKAYKQNISNS